MEENGEDSHAMQTEEIVEELTENHDAAEDAELKDAQKIVKGSGRKSKKHSKKKAPSGDQGTPKKTEKKQTPKKPESKEPITPTSDRPARERKSIDRFADTIEREKERPKEFKIEQGNGTCLRDIPNVVFKLSKHKTSDESVQLLHKLLYNKKVKPYQVKSNILQFSGCVWGLNEEKEKSKMKDKLEKCVKDNLWQVSDLLDLNITKTTKKEDLVMRVLEFLDCPHKTTEKVLQEEEQKSREKKRKKSSSKGKRRKSSSQTPRKRQKQEANEEDIEEDVVEYEDNEDDSQEEPKEDSEEEPEEVPVKKKSIKIKEPSRDAKSSSAKKRGKKPAKKLTESEEINEDPEEPVQEEPEEEPKEAPEERKRKRSKNKKYEDDVVSKSPKKTVQKADVVSKAPKKTVQKAAKKSSVYEPEAEDLDDDKKDVKSKPLSKVSQKAAVSPKDAKTPVGSPSKEKKKAADTGSSKASSKKNKEEQEDDAPLKVPKKGRGANNSDVKEVKSNAIPPDEDLREAICELLRDADFSTVTFTDVVKQLGAKFDVDLSQNKAHVKNLIQEEISKIVDEDDGEGENEEEEAGINTPEKEEKESVAED